VTTDSPFCAAYPFSRFLYSLRLLFALLCSAASVLTALDYVGTALRIMKFSIEAARAQCLACKGNNDEIATHLIGVLWMVLLISVFFFPSSILLFSFLYLLVCFVFLSL
jgi:hypothetical protein